MGKKRKKKDKPAPKGKHFSSLAEQLSRVKLDAEDVVAPEQEARSQQKTTLDIPAEHLDDLDALPHQSPGVRGRAQQTALDDHEMLALWESEDEHIDRHRTPGVSGGVQRHRTGDEQRALELMRDELTQCQQENRRLHEQVAALASLRTKLATLERQRREQEVARRAAVEAAVAAVEEASARREQRALRERDEARKVLAEEQATHVYTPLSDAMRQRGLPAALQAEALAALASAQATALLPLLAVQSDGIQGLLEQHIALCCQHERCIEELGQGTSRVLLTVAEPALCENCQGSDNRRAFRRMVRMCRERRIYRIIVVGGSPDAHTELEKLTPDGFIQRIVTGKERRNKKQATEDLRHADLLVVWGPTILPHKISELYTKQKEDYPNKVALVLKRGVASFAREVCEFLEELDQSRRVGAESP